MKQMSDDWWLGMARDPGMQALRQMGDSSIAFNDDEFVALLKATFKGIATTEAEEEFNRAFTLLKLYRLHESILQCALSGYLVITGVDGDDLLYELKPLPEV